MYKTLFQKSACCSVSEINSKNKPICQTKTPKQTNAQILLSIALLFLYKKKKPNNKESTAVIRDERENRSILFFYFILLFY